MLAAAFLRDAGEWRAEFGGDDQYGDFCRRGIGSPESRGFGDVLLSAWTLCVSGVEGSEEVAEASAVVGSFVLLRVDAFQYRLRKQAGFEYSLYSCGVVPISGCGEFYERDDDNAIGDAEPYSDAAVRLTLPHTFPAKYSKDRS